MGCSRSFCKLSILLLLLCFLIQTTSCSPVKGETVIIKNKQDVDAKEEVKQQLEGASTVIRPANIFKTDGDSMVTKPDGEKSFERNLRPFEWLYQQLGEYLMCAYGKRVGCEQKLANAINLDQTKPQLVPSKQEDNSVGMVTRPKPLYPSWQPMSGATNHDPMFTGPFMRQNMPWRPPMQPQDGAFFLGQQPYFGPSRHPQQMSVMEPARMGTVPYGRLSGYEEHNVNAMRPMLLMNPIERKEDMKTENNPMGPVLVGQFPGMPAQNMPPFPMAIMMRGPAGLVPFQ
ncbi:uncharacterized protein DEA37_0000493 [Paragonimus westermani]|uniref:Uncharacterized protein n=1 Tax=Paragonimus westermani TaxID=34504 RepID=A0A5J4NZP4_9TREM|nr:uncharacterized protein DEA37_0000493 [Paragonimus westermani]